MDFSNDIIIKHYVDNWGHSFSKFSFEKGPMKNLSKDFFILEFPAKKERKFWSYATCGLATLETSVPLELHIFSATQDRSLVELLTLVGYYHASQEKLGLWHTVYFGRPWQRTSACEYGLISLPYLDGPSLEKLPMVNGKEINFYWLIPITKEEREYKKQYGIDALEAVFESKPFNYLNTDRSSLV